MQQSPIFDKRLLGVEIDRRVARRRGRLVAVAHGPLDMGMPVPPKGFGGHGVCCVCSAVSYFSTRVGSIIGAGRLSFRVRDGSGRFPVAVAAVTLFTRFWV
jgi:hypothetical protein